MSASPPPETAPSPAAAPSPVAAPSPGGAPSPALEPASDDIFSGEGREGEEHRTASDTERNDGGEREDEGAGDNHAEGEGEGSGLPSAVNTGTNTPGEGAEGDGAPRIPSFKKRRGSGGESGGDDDEERQRKKKKKDRRRDEVVEDEEEEPLDEATRRRHALEERIDNIGKKQRVVRRKKKGGEDVDIVDSYHDDVCARLSDRMMSAAAKDAAANQQKLPATNKLAMLDEVVAVLQNTTLWSSIIDSDVLKAVKEWLDPLPDKSLPSPGIQRAIFEVLPRMDLDTATIRESKLGPVVLFYTKTKRVTPAINRQADALVQAWSRPIIKRSADFRSRFIATAEDIERETEGRAERDREGEVDRELDAEGSERPRRPKSKSAPKSKRFDVRSALAENETRKGARLPQMREVQYTVAPESRLQHHVEDLHHVSRIQMDNKKFNRFARQLKAGKRG